jgi:hypothetical protein
MWKTVRAEEPRYGNFPTMNVQIVLVIVAAVQVNSQQLCPSVCQCDSKQAACTDLFSDVTDMTQHRFHPALRELRVHGTTNLEPEEDRFLRWNITSLTYLDLSQNNITKIWQAAFYSLAYLEDIYLKGNNISTVNSQTFCHNTRLVVLSLANNCITDIHPSTFRNNTRLRHTLLSGNKITSVHPDVFKDSMQLEWLDLADNSITDIHPSTFRNNSRLQHLDLSGNKIKAISPGTFD